VKANTNERLQIRIRLEHDEDTPNPFEDDCYFKIITATGANHKEVDDLQYELGKKNAEENKDWWWLSVYRHGGEHWFLQNGPTPTGADYFDTAQFAGILVLENSNEFEDPEAAAKSMLDTFNKWLAGDSWYWRIEQEIENNVEGRCPCCQEPDTNWYEYEFEEVAAVGCFIGSEHAMNELISELKAHIEDSPELLKDYEVVIETDSAGSSYYDEIANEVRALGLVISGEDEDDN